MDEKIKNRNLKIYAGISTAVIIALVIVYFMFPKTIIEIKNIPINRTILKTEIFYVNKSDNLTPISIYTIVPNKNSKAYFLFLSSNNSKFYLSQGLSPNFYRGYTPTEIDDKMGKYNISYFRIKLPTKFKISIAVYMNNVLYDIRSKNISVFYVNGWTCLTSPNQPIANITQYNLTFENGYSATITRINPETNPNPKETFDHLIIAPGNITISDIRNAISQPCNKSDWDW